MAEKPQIEKISAAFSEQELPADLILALVWLAANIVVLYLPVLNESPIRVLLSVLTLLFLPGYCLVAALFPQNDDIDLIERIALSFGLSIAIVPLIGLGLNFTPWGIRLEPIVLALTLFMLMMVLIAHYRRAVLPPEERFSIPFSGIASSLREGLFPAESSRVDRLLSVLLIFAILTAVITSVYVIAVPKQGERFTEFFILGEGQRAADYPDQIEVGQEYPLYIGVGNQEYRNVTYTIETWGMVMEFDNATTTTRIVAMDPLWRHSVTLAHNETIHIPYTLSVEKPGYNRIEFLLFNETVPGPEVSREDRITASYRDLHLNVQEFE
jgi:uncharacterized membrane protein